MKKNLTVALLCLCVAVSAQQIPSTFWGINHWMPKKYLNHPNNPAGRIEMPSVQQLVMNMGARFYRIGGDGYDTFGTAIGVDSMSNDYIRAIQIIRAANSNARFLVQIPFKCGTFTPDSAAKLVQNLKSFFSTLPPFHYAIGNEWDRYKYSNGRPILTVDIATPIRNFAKAIKNVEPNCKIVAPSLSFESATDSLGQPIMTRLIGGADDITGLISGTGNVLVDGIKYFVDVINIHSYGGGSGNLRYATNAANFFTGRAGLINYAGVSGQGHHQDLTHLIGLLNNVNTGRSGSPLTFAVTEMNVCYKNQPAPVNGNKYTNTTEGISARSFFAGQHFLDIMSSTLEKGTLANSAKVEFVMPWSIHESGGNGDTLDLSMTKGAAISSAPTPLPSYYHYKLMADHFHGKYFPSASNNKAPAVKAFASVEDSAGVYVMVLNRDSVGYEFNIDLQNNTPTGKPLLLKFNIPSTMLPLDSIHNWNDTVGANETILLLYNCHGKRMWKMKYNLADALQDGQPHFKIIGNHNVDPDMANCETGMFQGNVTSNTTFSNQTLYITGDVNLVNCKLTLNNVKAVISPGVEIYGGAGSSIEIKNGSVLFGCDGPWDGIRLEGTNTTGEKIDIQDSYIYKAVNPVKGVEIPDVRIIGNMMANGETAIDLDECQVFTIHNNVVGCYTTGIHTSQTPTGYASNITLNNIIHVTNGIEFDSDDHSALTVQCNVINFKEYGIYSRNTLLADIGNSMMGAGNVFMKMNGPQENFIDHTGSAATTYYMGPYESAIYTGQNVMTLNQGNASMDNICAASVLAAYTCKSLVNGVTDRARLKNDFTVYPNPSKGVFNMKTDAKGSYVMTVYDVTGKEIINRSINFSVEERPVFEIKERGFYIVTLRKESEHVSRKIVVE